MLIILLKWNLNHYWSFYNHSNDVFFQKELYKCTSPADNLQLAHLFHCSWFPVSPQRYQTCLLQLLHKPCCRSSKGLVTSDRILTMPVPFRWSEGKPNTFLLELSKPAILLSSLHWKENSIVFKFSIFKNKSGWFVLSPRMSSTPFKTKNAK